MSEMPAPSNIPEFTVGQISAAVRNVLETRFQRVRVRGEVSGFKRAASGHLYFNLKDTDGVLAAVCWRGAAGRLGFRPEDGLEVVATGRITAYGPRSAYQMVVESLEIAGEGALLKLLEERRRALAAEGLFDPERKRPIPFLPDRVGVITSPTGAVVRDILHRFRDRFPTHVLIWPVLVQGDGAAEGIAAAIRGFGTLPDGIRPDVLIVARGGGSLEDLWAFNEEPVVRAAASSRIPLISAVGHETDTTLIDHAADLRAPTPTAAAEMAVPVRSDLLGRIGLDGERLLAAGVRLVGDRRVLVEGLGRGLPEPRTVLEQAGQRLDERAELIFAAMRTRLGADGLRATEISARLRHPREVLGLAAERLGGMADRYRSAGMLALERSSQALGRLDPGRRLSAALERQSEQAEARLARAAALLESYSYHGVLARGFALVKDGDTPVMEASRLDPGRKVKLVFRDGDVDARVLGERKSPRPGEAARQTAQQTLF